jgi:glucose/mannose transport system permease protein
MSYGGERVRSLFEILKSIPRKLKSIPGKMRATKRVVFSRKTYTKDTILSLILFLPAFLLVIYFVYGLIGWNIWVSVSNWQSGTLSPDYSFGGFGQYAGLFSDPLFVTSLVNNIILIVVFVPGTLALGLILAILLDSKVRGGGVFRNIYLLPFALAFVVTATLWTWMFEPEAGVLNTILGGVGLSSLKSGWITQSGLALACVIIALVWQFSGYTMLIFTAGMRSIPESQIMAAEVDGAKGLAMYRRVVIPQLKTSALSAFVVLMIFALKVFDLVYVMTGGGPGTSTYVLSYLFFRDSFTMTQFAKGAAIGTVMFLLAIVVVLPYLYLSSRREKE